MYRPTNRPASRHSRRSARPAPAPNLEPLENRVLFSAGDLDTTFSGDGKLAVPNTQGGRGAGDVFVYADGKVLTAGGETSASGSDVLVTRYNANGTLDTGFGNGGRAKFDFGGDESSGRVAVAPDGTIVVAVGTSKGKLQNSWVLARLTPAGKLDTTFSGDGKVSLGIGGQVNDVAVAPGNKVVAVGRSGASDFTVMRFTASGDADASFSGDGKQTMRFGPGPDAVSAVAVMSDGRIVAAGTTFLESPDGFGTSIVVGRLRADGSPDTTFSGDGKVATRSPSPGIADIRGEAVAVQPDGKIVAGGGADFTAVRYNPNGSLDATFGTGGIASAGTQGGSHATSLAIAADGKVLLAGTKWDGPLFESSKTDFAVARYSAAGKLDTTFGGDGWATTDVARNEERAYAVAAAPGGKVVAVGSAVIGNSGVDLTARYNANGSPDASFAGDGTVVGAPGYVERRVFGTAVQREGKTLVVGSTVSGLAGDFYVARYNANGSPDTSFSGDGVATIDFGGNFDVASDVLLQGDGKIVIGGWTTSNLRGDYTRRGDTAVARLNANGTPDTSFSGDGRATARTNTTQSHTDLALQANGGVVAGNLGGVVRFTSSGAPDTTFAGDGKADVQAAALANMGDKIVVAGPYRLSRLNANGTIDTGFRVTTFADGDNDDSIAETLTDVAVGPDGRVYAAAYYDGYFVHKQFEVLSFNADGSPNTGYGQFGRARTDAGMEADISSGGIAIQPDGKVVISGSGLTQEAGENASFVARFTTAGVLDTDFGIEGVAVTTYGYPDADLALTPAGDIVLATYNPTGQGGYGLLRFDGTGAEGSITRDGDVLVVKGNTTADTISLSGSGGTVTVNWNGVSRSFTSVAAVRVYGRGGDDTITVGPGLPQSKFPRPLVYVSGGSGNDRLVGSAGMEELHGGAGDDVMDGGLGADWFYGEDGFDTVDYSSRTAPVTVIHTGDANEGQAGEGDYFPADAAIEAIRGGSGNDRFSGFRTTYGGAGDDVLTGTESNDLLYGGAGNDTLTGGDGKDQLRGESGNDTLFADGDGSADFLDGGSGTDKARKDKGDFAQYVEQFLA